MDCHRLVYFYEVDLVPDDSELYSVDGEIYCIEYRFYKSCFEFVTVLNYDIDNPYTISGSRYMAFIMLLPLSSSVSTAGEAYTAVTHVYAYARQ